MPPSDAAALTVRPATRADVEWIVAVVSAAARGGTVRPVKRESVVAALANASREPTIALAGGERVGHALLGCETPRLWELRLIVVSDRGRGYGRAFLRHLIAHVFDERHAHKLWLEVKATNERAIGLYESEGFKREACFRDGYPNGDGSFADLLAYGLFASERLACGPEPPA